MTLEHYKARYHFYKQKCELLEGVLARFREFLETVPAPASTNLNSPCTPVKSESDNQQLVGPQEQSPILCRGIKRQLFKRSKEEKKSKAEEDEDEEYRNFELGSNKWECVDLPDESSLELSPDHTAPLERLKKLKKYSGLEMWSTTAVSHKIRGVERRQLPGWPCDQCRAYYEANNFGPEVANRVSRHRCTHQRIPSPPGYWDLNLDRYTKNGASDTE